VTEFKEHRGGMEAVETDTTPATARVPGLDIEIVHRRAVEGDAEEISINFRAAPSFEAFGRALEVAKHTARLVPVAARPGLPWILALPRPSGEGTSRSTPERASPVS
jgi:hypothetical protein